MEWHSTGRVRTIGLAVTLGVLTLCGAPGKPTSGPLIFRILLPHSAVCVGDRRIEVESELRDVSDHSIALSPAGVRSQVSFTNRACSLEDGFRSSTISVDPPRDWKEGKIVNLAPGQSYRQTLKLELDPKFFLQGVYRVQIGYSGKYGASDQGGLFAGTLDSNDVLFEIVDCNSSSGETR